MKSNKLVALCSCPTVLQMMGEKNVGVVTTAQTIRKMHTTHGLSEETIYTAIEKLDEPAYVFKDKEGSYVFIPGVIAKNAKGNDSDIEIPIILERAKDGSHYVASAYALDDFQKIESWIKNGKLVYAKTLQAQPSTNGVREVTPNFEHLVVGLSSTDNLLTGTDLVNFKFAAKGISDSFSAGDAEAASLSLRRRVDRNINSLLNERETTLARVSNYIKREADRTANIMGSDTELQRAGVHFAQANAIINAWTPTSSPKTSSAKTPQNTAASATCATSSTNTSQSPAKANYPCAATPSKPPSANASKHNSPQHAKPPPTPRRTGEPPSPPTGSRGESTNMKRRIWQCR